MRMNRLWAWALALLLLFSMCGCRSRLMATAPRVPTETVPETVPVIPDDAFVFSHGPIPLWPGLSAPGDKLPAPDSVYAAPRADGSGSERIYTYPTFEMTAYVDDFGVETLYAIAFYDDSAATDEGIRVGASEEEVLAAYGEDFTEDEGVRVYTRGQTQLRFILLDGTVTYIEYRGVGIGE